MKLYKKILLLAIAGLSTIGCVERSWRIESEPSGALVYVSGVEKGRTPVTIDFLHYGTYEVILRKEGYQTLTESVELNPPWYQAPGVDFFAEISPKKYEDRRRTMHIMRLKRKATPQELEALKRRAEDLRHETNTGQKRDTSTGQGANTAPADRFDSRGNRR